VTVLDERASGGRPLGVDDSAAAQALFEEARHRRRQRHRTFGIVLVMVVVIAVPTSLFVRHVMKPTAPAKSGHSAPAVRSPKNPMPSQMVVWAQTSPSTVSIEVIASKTGRVLRTLATDDGLFRGTPQPAVSATGTVFFDDAIASAGPGTPPPREQIMSVPLGGGATSVVAPGHDPSVSPNGQLLAYQTFTDISDAPEGIVVLNLGTGTSTTWQFATNAPDMSGGLSWSSDSSTLVFQYETPVQNAAFDVTTRLLHVTAAGGLLDQTPQVSLPLCPPPTSWASPGAGRAMTWAGYLNGVDGIGVCHHAGLTQQDDWYQPVIVNLDTGRVVGRLPVIHNLDGIGGIQVDLSGHYLAFIGNGPGRGGLYRWTIGQNAPRALGHPVLVKDGVGSAAWVPSP
jgi:hypothetical protein